MLAIVMSWLDMGCPYRREAYDFCRAHWERTFPQTPIFVGATEPYSRASGINHGVRQAAAAGATVIFQPDPDTLLDPLQLFVAIKMAEDAPGVVNPYGHYLYLTEDASREILDGSPWVGVFHEGHAEESGPLGSGLAAVYTVDTWMRAGGFDERFGVWAGDDGAFAYASHWLVAPGRRTSGYAYHLYHPRHPDSIVGSPGYQKQFAILAPYRDAQSADDIRNIIEGRSP